MSSLCDATKRRFFDALKAVVGRYPNMEWNYKEITDMWDHYEEVGIREAKENQKENIKLMEEGYRRQPELITGEKIDCLVQCPNCGKKIGEVIDGTINPEIVKKMFVRDDK